MTISVKRRTFYIPEDEKSRILETYGDMTIEDFDAQGFNDAIGELYPGAKLKSSYASIYGWMLNNDPRVLYDKLDDKWSDIFNIVHSIIRSTKGQKVWYL